MPPPVDPTENETDHGLLGLDRLRPMPVARVRVTPIALGGTIVWAVALTVVLVADLGTLARDIGLVGTFLGLIATPVARAYDSRHTRAATSSHPGG